LAKLVFAVLATGGVAVATVLEVTKGRSWSALAGIATAGAALFASLVSVIDLRRTDARQASNRVFIIYAHEDHPQARAVADWLRTEGFSPWLDLEQIEPGSQWRQVIRSALSESGAALVLVSDHLDPSVGQVADEIRTARAILHSRDKQLSPVLPVLIGHGHPPSIIADIQAVQFSDEQSRTRLKEGLRRVLSG
jgi:hypothetical protein